MLCSTDVRINLLPPELSKVQFVNYCAQDKRAAFALVKALQGLPPSVPLPSQLPAEPPVPQSYLGGLRVQIESRERLDRAQQSTLLIQIRERLEDPEMREDALELLRLLRSRDDLLAAIDRGIEELLEDEPKPVRVPEEKPKRIPKTPPVTRVKTNARSIVRHLPPPLPQPPPLPDYTAVAARKLQLTKTAVGAVVQEVISNGETLMMQAAEDSVTLSIAEDQLAVVGSFQRWTPKELKLLQGRGWESGNRAMQGLAAGAIGVIGAATWGLGLGVLLHKGAREYVCSNVVSKRFAFDELEDAVAAVRDVCRCWRRVRARWNCVPRRRLSQADGGRSQARLLARTGLRTARILPRTRAGACRAIRRAGVRAARHAVRRRI